MRIKIRLARPESHAWRTNKPAVIVLPSPPHRQSASGMATIRAGAGTSATWCGQGVTVDVTSPTREPFQAPSRVPDVGPDDSPRFIGQ